MAAGLPGERVISLSRGDSLTIPRPRIELQWLPETYTRTGRKLGHIKNDADKTRRTLKRELYQVKLDVSANILAETSLWIAAFERDFLAALPRSGNDTAGNWVKIRAARAEWANTPETRVGLDVIKVFEKAAKLLVISFMWRITEEEAQRLIPRINLDFKGVLYGEGKSD